MPTNRTPASSGEPSTGPLVQVVLRNVEVQIFQGNRGTLFSATFEFVQILLKFAENLFFEKVFIRCDMLKTGRPRFANRSVHAYVVVGRRYARCIILPPFIRVARAGTSTRQRGRIREHHPPGAYGANLAEPQQRRCVLVGGRSGDVPTSRARAECQLFASGLGR